MSDLIVMTYQDACDNLRDLFGINRGSKEDRVALRAVQRAYAKFPDLHRWSYYERRARLTTVASQQTGSIAYDHTGGSSERLVTLTGATFPSTEATLYKIIIENRQYDIETFVDSTHVTLTAKSNPGADVASGTSYTLYKSRYHVPIDFRKMCTDLIDLVQSDTLKYVEPARFLELMRSRWQPQDPDFFTVHSPSEHYGAFVIEVGPPPSIAETWEYIYEAGGRPLRTERYNTGTLTTDGTTSVVGSSTVWAARHVGAILRVPISGTTEPGGIVGAPDEPAGTTVEPFDEQRSILTVPTTTTLTVDSAISTRSGVGYTISDPIDMAPGTMTEAFLALCEATFAKMNRRKDWRDYDADFRKALREAMSADNRERELNRSSPGIGNTLDDWATGQSLDGGSAI